MNEKAENLPVPLGQSGDNPGDSRQSYHTQSRFRRATRQLESNLRILILRPKTTIALICLAAVAAVTTIVALTLNLPLSGRPELVVHILYFDLFVLALLGSLVSWRILRLWRHRKKGVPGARLHARLIVVFTLLAAIPALAVTLFSIVFFNFGIQAWFSERVRTAVTESLAVAEAYVEEHQQVIRADILAMAKDLERDSYLLLENQRGFEHFVRNQALLRNFSEAVVFDSSGRVLARAGFTFSMEFEPVPDPILDRARDGEVVLMTGKAEDRVRALVKLNNYVDTYLFVGRFVDERVLQHLADTQDAVRQYTRLEDRRFLVQLVVATGFGFLALFLLLGAVWMGFRYGQRLVGPIAQLSDAAAQIGQGNLSVRVPEKMTDEFAVLAQTFNRMTAQLADQKQALLQTNRQLDERRRLTETVLTGVSSGVLRVDEDHYIQMANEAASKILRKSQADLENASLDSVLPGLADRWVRDGDTETETEIRYTTPEGSTRHIHARVSGNIVTFDDITDLLAAQRKAAWADVARRIAHEIKNPLTPIQLAAERLKRRFLPQIEEGSEVFTECTDTIIRHVEDIGRMVREFSAFARMPEPVMRPHNLRDLIDQTIGLQKSAYSRISFELEDQQSLAGSEIICDSQLIRQALTNVVQNAVEAIRAEDPDSEGRIAFRIMPLTDQSIRLSVYDNGPGFPEGDRLKLLEPYITNREKGTGLGLAIVKKIMDDHKGRIVLGPWGDETPPEGCNGGQIHLVLPFGRLDGTEDSFKGHDQSQNGNSN